MIEENNAQVYSEVYGVLNSLGTAYINAIPKKLYELISEKREKSFNPTYNVSVPLSQQNISKKATAFICMLHYNYWCKSDEEKEKINKILAYNTKKNKEKYFAYEKKFESKMPQTFKDDTTEKELSLNKKNKALVVKKENTWFKKFLLFLKGIFIK